MKWIITLTLLAATLIAKDILIYIFSLECNKIEKNTTKYKICANKELLKLDKELLEVYESFYFSSNQIKNDQKAWVKKRNICKDISYIKQEYKERLKRLKNSLSNQNSFPKFILDTMQKVQKSMKLYWAPYLFETNEDIKKQLKFNEDFYRFENIRYTPSL